VPTHVCRISRYSREYLPRATRANGREKAIHLKFFRPSDEIHRRIDKFDVIRQSRRVSINLFIIYKVSRCAREMICKSRSNTMFPSFASRPCRVFLSFSILRAIDQYAEESGDNGACFKVKLQISPSYHPTCLLDKESRSRHQRKQIRHVNNIRFGTRRPCFRLCRHHG